MKLTLSLALLTLLTACGPKALPSDQTSTTQVAGQSSGANALDFDSNYDQCFPMFTNVSENSPTVFTLIPVAKASSEQDCVAVGNNILQVSPRTSDFKVFRLNNDQLRAVLTQVFGTATPTAAMVKGLSNYRFAAALTQANLIPVFQHDSLKYDAL